MKTKEQMYMEARDHLERKIENLEQSKIELENEIENIRKLIEELCRIYE